MQDVQYGEALKGNHTYNYIYHVYFLVLQQIKKLKV